VIQFKPDGFVGKSGDDNTQVGLLRRMLAAGHRAFIGPDGSVEVDMDESEMMIHRMEEHFGAAHVRPVDGL